MMNTTIACSGKSLRYQGKDFSIQKMDVVEDRPVVVLNPPNDTVKEIVEKHLQRMIDGLSRSPSFDEIQAELDRHYYNTMKFRILIEQDEDGKFIASCPTLPGCISDGNTRDEAVANMKEAMEGYLASVQKSGDPLPLPISEEIVDVNLGRIEGAA